MPVALTGAFAWLLAEVAAWGLSTRNKALPAGAEVAFPAALLTAVVTVMLGLGGCLWVDMPALLAAVVCTSCVPVDTHNENGLETSDTTHH